MSSPDKDFSSFLPLETLPRAPRKGSPCLRMSHRLYQIKPTKSQKTPKDHLDRLSTVIECRFTFVVVYTLFNNTFLRI